MDNKIFGFELFKNWHCRFSSQIPQANIKAESRIAELAKRVKLEGADILELGCLEGQHSFMLHCLGARKIVAIEGREENFLKCLVVKNAFNLDRCKFLFADVEEILPKIPDRFDICLALGILYHLKNPVEIIYKLSELSDTLFVWTHYATKDFPKGDLAYINYNGVEYKGKYVREDLTQYLSGLKGDSFWLLEDDLLRLTKEAGFKNLEVISKENHEHGPAITFLAKK